MGMQPRETYTRRGGLLIQMAVEYDHECKQYTNPPFSFVDCFDPPRSFCSLFPPLFPSFPLAVGWPTESLDPTKTAREKQKLGGALVEIDQRIEAEVQHDHERRKREELYPERRPQHHLYDVCLLEKGHKKLQGCSRKEKLLRGVVRGHDQREVPLLSTVNDKRASEQTKRDSQAACPTLQKPHNPPALSAVQGEGARKGRRKRFLQRPREQEEWKAKQHPYFRPTPNCH